MNALQIPIGRAGLLLIVCLVIALLSSGCTSQTQYQGSGGVDDSGASSQPVQTTSSKGELEILEHHSEVEGEYFKSMYVVGLAKNVGGKRISYGSVEAKFYDADGNLLGNSLDNVNDLDSGETWKFKIMYLGSDVDSIASYKIGVGSSW